MEAFTKVDETLVAEGHRFTVHSVRYRSSDGRDFDRDVVRHPGAVAVLPLHDDGSVTLVKQFRAALAADLIELPAGLRDVAGEADSDAAARELAEEVGLAADVLDHLVTFHNSPGFCDESVAVFVGTGLREIADDRQGIEEEAMTVIRLPLGEALAMVADGRITDAKTIIGLSLVAARA